MARTTKPLTHTEISQAKPRDKVYKLSDGGGLHLRINTTGSKIWVLDYYRPYTKVRVNITFGAFPQVSLASARGKRDEARALLAENIDPKEYRDEQAARRQAAHTDTLKHVTKQWLEVKKTKVTPEHAHDSWRSLELHVFTSLGALPITKITAVKAIDTIQPIAAKGSLEPVKRLCQRLNEVMVYAVNTGLLTANPLAGIQNAFQSPTKQRQPTVAPIELRVLTQALSTASIKRTTRSLIEWQLHTIVRPGEAAGTRWDEIDLERDVWVIPAERMKKKKPHAVPLSPQTITLLELMQPISGRSEYVFPSDRSPKVHTHPQTANTALKRMGFHKKVAHGMRSLASTILNEQGFDPDIIEAALAHTGKNEVRNAYNRAQYIERRKPLMNWWSGHIEKAATGNMSRTGTRHLSVVNS